MAKIKLNCPVCNQEFLKEKGEYNRSQRKGRKTYCSPTCSQKVTNKNLLEGCIENLKVGGSHLRDEFTPFRWFLRNARKRKNRGPTDLDLEYLKQLWEKQEGRCPFTNWDLILPEGNDYPRNVRSMYKASLDRIDNDLGYVKGNVRFVSVIANYCRNTFSDKEVMIFCEAVATTTTLRRKYDK